jgi:hypothetical protein
LLGLLGNRHGQFSQHFGRFCVSPKRQEQLLQLIARESFGATPEAKALGEQQAEGELVSTTIHAEEQAHHLIDDGSTLPLSKPARQLGLERL